MGRRGLVAGHARRQLARWLAPPAAKPLWLGIAALAVALLGLAVRLVYLHDAVPVLHTAGQPGVRMAARYSEAAYALLDGDGLLYPRVRP